MDTSVFALHTRPAPDGWTWLLSDDAHRRVWLQRMLLAYALLLGLHGLRAVGLIGQGMHLDALLVPVACDLLWMSACYASVRSGRTAHRSDPARTALQVGLALLSVVLSFIWIDVGRAAAAPLAGTILALALYHLSPRTLLVQGIATMLALSLATWVQGLMSDDATGVRPWMGLAALALCLPAMAWASHRARLLKQEHEAQRSALQEALTRLDALTTQDTLTGLANHRHMQAVLQAECKRHARTGRPFCVALLDIDGLQAINNTLGRAQGDEIIRQLAALASNHLRTSDLMARWSGEEFMILMPETPHEGGLRSLERLREHLRTRWGFYQDGRWVPVNCSVGVTQYRSGESLAALLQRAEQALRQAQSRGQDQVAST